MFPNVLNSQSLQYYNKYITEYRHHYEEILKHYSAGKSKTIAYQNQDSILVPTPPYFVENLLNDKTDKEESSVESPLSSEYNDDTSPPMTTNHLNDARNNVESPPMSPVSQEDTGAYHKTSTAKTNSHVDGPKDYSVSYRTQPTQFRHVSSYAIDRICPSPKTVSSSNGTSSPVDSENLTPPATGEFNSYTEETYASQCSEKLYGKFSPILESRGIRVQCFYSFYFRSRFQLQAQYRQ